MIIYRVGRLSEEENFGRGIYSSTSALTSLHDNMDRPNPEDDFSEFSMFRHEYLFAFTSKDKLVEWIGDCILSRLQSEGFSIIEIEVDSSYVWVSDSEKQCFFNPSNALPIQVHEDMLDYLSDCLLRIFS